MEHKKQLRIYLLLTAVFMVLAIIMFFLPDKRVDKELSPRTLIKLYNHGNAYYSVDKVAKMIIDENPALQLVDVRSEAEFAEFSLPGAINIPLEKILEKDEHNNYVWKEYLRPEKKITVFYSNGDLKAAQAWTLATRLRMDKVFMLEGGLNNWFDKIMTPEAPKATTATPEEYAAYEFRKMAKTFFGRANAGQAASITAEENANSAPVVKKKKVVSEGGGC